MTPTLWLYRLAMSTIVAGTMMVGYVFWPVQLVYIDEPMRIRTSKRVRGGEWLGLEIRYSKPQQHESLVGFMFASRGNVALTPVGLSALPQGEHVFVLHVQVPPALPAGEYVVIMIAERQVRLPLPAVFDRPVTATSEPFEVVQ